MRFYEFHGTSWWKEGFFRALAIFAGWLAVADSSPEGMRPALVFLAALAALALGEGQSAAHRLYLWGVDLRDQELRRLRRSLLSGAMAIVAAALALVPVGAGAAPLAALASVGGGVLLVAGWRGIFGDGCVTLLVGSTAGALALVATLHGYRVPLPAVLGAASAAAILGSIGLAAQCFALDEAHLRREMGKAGG